MQGCYGDCSRRHLPDLPMAGATAHEASASRAVRAYCSKARRVAVRLAEPFLSLFPPPGCLLACGKPAGNPLCLFGRRVVIGNLVTTVLLIITYLLSCYLYMQLSYHFGNKVTFPQILLPTLGCN